MYERISLLVRRPELSHAEFVDAWRAGSAAVGADDDGVVRYRQVLPTEPEAAEFDGLAEVSVERLEDLPDGDDRRDRREFLALEECAEFVGERTVQTDEVDGDTDGLYKHSAFLVRKDGLSHEEFLEYWQTNHTPIAREIEGVVKYDTLVPPDPESATFDGVAELYFEDLESLYDALGSEGSRDYDPERGAARKAREDVDEFLAIEDRPRFIGRERVVRDDRSN
ncbi:EthD domain-containing protein [Natrarchaeobius oligotrophus]|uniref:EthD family reductase n=1 Tax=Natrarchaeobius chitinivorans TaxID=1679083 RepID=A0A3N6MJD4_NATCH|nr:EthD domain-containing protein [Natrarchaeobius chitinivorans]RQH01405.1 EthD family reductase [Natrarchaeobius chitinivorans]